MSIPYPRQHRMTPAQKNVGSLKMTLQLPAAGGCVPSGPFVMDCYETESSRAFVLGLYGVNEGDVISWSLDGSFSQLGTCLDKPALVVDVPSEGGSCVATATVNGVALSVLSIDFETPCPCPELPPP